MYAKNMIRTLAAVALLVGCAADEPSTETALPVEQVAAAPQEVVVTARDYTFDAPDTISSGPTSIRLVNEGPELHHVYLVRLEEGKTLEDLASHMASSHAFPSWAVEYGGPNTPMGTGENSAAVDLPAGDYVLLCAIPSPDGVPHVMKGMVRKLTVVPSTAAPAALPEAHLVMTLDDYSFTTSAPITAGTHTIRVENAAAQGHEVIFVRLEPGKTAADFIGFVEKPQGPPPGVIVGGITGITRGISNTTTVEFAPGEYALICFIPDVADGRPHFVHGMVHQFTVN